MPMRLHIKWCSQWTHDRKCLQKEALCEEHHRKKEPFEGTHMQHFLMFIACQHLYIETLKKNSHLKLNFKASFTIICPECDNMLYHITYLNNKSQGLIL